MEISIDGRLTKSKNDVNDLVINNIEKNTHIMQNILYILKCAVIIIFFFNQNQHTHKKKDFFFNSRTSKYTIYFTSSIYISYMIALLKR